MAASSLVSPGNWVDGALCSSGMLRAGTLSRTTKEADAERWSWSITQDFPAPMGALGPGSASFPHSQALFTLPSSR